MNRLNWLCFEEYFHSRQGIHLCIADAIRRPNGPNKFHCKHLNEETLNYLFEVCRPYWENTDGKIKEVSK